MLKLPSFVVCSILVMTLLVQFDVLWAAVIPPAAGAPAALPAGTAAPSQPGKTPTAAPPGPKAPTAAPGVRVPPSVALAKKISVDFNGTSFDSALQTVRDKVAGLNIIVDPEVSSSGAASPLITLKARDISVKSVLKLITSGSDLGWKEEPGYLLITTRDKLQQSLPLTSYRINDLLDDPNQLSDLGSVISLAVNSKADPDVAAWSEEGGPAAIVISPDGHREVINVTQSPRGHERIQDLLNQLRFVLTRHAKPPVAALAAAKADARLQKKITVDVTKTPVKDVLKIIDDKLGGVNLIAAPTIMTEAEAGPFERPVDLEVKDVTAESVLQLILRPDLAYTVQPDYILVATPKRLPRELVTVVYPGLLGEAAWRGADKAHMNESTKEIALPMIQKTVNNTSDPNVAAWSDEGGPASITQFRNAIIITQNRLGHERVAERLGQMFRQPPSGPTRPGAK